MIISIPQIKISTDVDGNHRDGDPERANGVGNEEERDHDHADHRERVVLHRVRQEDVELK